LVLVSPHWIARLAEIELARISFPAKVTAALSSACDRTKSEIGGCGMILFGTRATATISDVLR
jgi:hypothetical protein